MSASAFGTAERRATYCLSRPLNGKGQCSSPSLPYSRRCGSACFAMISSVAFDLSASASAHSRWKA